MLRFVLQTNWKNTVNGAEGANLFTIDVSVPELEMVLRDGGFSESGYTFHQLVGVELIDESEPKE